MNNQRMIFDIDRRTVTEGDVVEVKWQCAEAESVQLTIDNGYRSTNIPLETSGSKRFRLNRSKGRTHLTIAVTIGGKTYRKKIAVRVKKMPTMKAETVDHRGRKVSAIGGWWQRVMTKWHDSRSKLHLAMQVLPERKQMAVKVMAIMGVGLIVSAIWPILYGLVPMLVAGYLIYVLIRR